MYRDDYKIKIGTIVGTIILLLNIFSILCELFDIKIVGFVSFAKLINDASAFQTFICLSFLLVSIFGEYSSLKLGIISSIDILIVNRLYSNTRWMLIIGWIRTINVGVALLIILICGFAIYLLHIFIVYKSTNSKNRRIRDLLRKSKDIDSAKQVEEDANYEDIVKLSKNFMINKGSNILKAICVFIITLGCMDYIIFIMIPLKIERPKELMVIPNILYYSVIISVAILITVILIEKLLFVRKEEGEFFKENGPNSNNEFRVSAIVAAILEVGLIFLYDKPELFTERYLN